MYCIISFDHIICMTLCTPQGIDVDDIAEIRPGRMSFSCDGSSHLPTLTIVGSETSISLPLDSVAIRNALLRQFQSFLMVFISYHTILPYHTISYFTTPTYPMLPLPLH